MFQNLVDLRAFKPEGIEHEVQGYNINSLYTRFLRVLGRLLSCERLPTGGVHSVAESMSIADGSYIRASGSLEDSKSIF